MTRGASLREHKVFIGGLSDVAKAQMRDSIHAWTDIAPATLSSGDNTLAANPADGLYNIVESLGIQNSGSVSRTVIVKNGATAVRQWVLAAGASVEISFAEGREWRFADALVVNASAASDLQITGGRYRVAAS